MIKALFSVKSAMMKKIIFSYVMLTVLSLIGVTAQNNEKSIRTISKKEASYILADVSFINDNVFMGRRDSIAAPYIFPSIGYYDKSGVFVDFSASYLTSSGESRFDLFLLSAGYLFTANNWSGGVSGNGYFFNDESYNVQSEMTAGITGLISYDLKAIEVSVTASSFFSSGNGIDFFGTFILDRVFELADSDILINPTISLSAGTQNFYEAYYQSNRLGNRKDHGSGGQNQTTSNNIKINEATQFNILNIELSAPIQYYYKSFILSFTPTLAFPQSGATITTEDEVFKENLESVFYWSAGISYWFAAKKKSSI